jgi:hypothetical protein
MTERVGGVGGGGEMTRRAWRGQRTAIAQPQTVAADCTAANTASAIGRGRQTSSRPTPPLSSSPRPRSVKRVQRRH